MDNNRLKKIISICFGVITFITIIGGCGMNKRNSMSGSQSETEEELVLNERQKQILIEQNVTPDVNEMNLYQKKCIIAIEEMLVSVEEKYNTKLCYIGYIPKQANVSYETVYAYPEGGDPDWDFFEIKRKDGVITDDYDCLLARPEYEERVTKLLDEVLVEEGCEYKIYSEIGTLDDEGKAIGAALTVYIKGIDESEYEAKFEEIKAQFVEKNMHVNISCYFLNDEIYDKLTQEDLITGVTGGELFTELIESK